MTTLYINANSLPRANAPEAAGCYAEILNRALCGAEKARGVLRWLNNGDSFEVELKSDAHQLIYLMDGKGTILLESGDWSVTKGAGVYLAPSETARIRQVGDAPLKLFHLTVATGTDAPFPGARSS